MPGMSDSHQALVILPRPSATIRPQEGVGGGTPAPRKLSDALRHDDDPDIEGEQHHEGVEHIGQDMDEHDPRGRTAVDPRQRHEVALLDRQHLAADDAREAGPEEEAERNHQRIHALAHRYGQQQREQDRREGERRVHDAHQEGVELAADIAGDDAEHEADAAADGKRKGCHDQAHPRAVKEAGQQVAAENVGAEQIFRRATFLPERRQQLVRQRLVDRRVRREPRREDGNENHRCDDREGSERKPPHRPAYSNRILGST